MLSPGANLVVMLTSVLFQRCLILLDLCQNNASQHRMEAQAAKTAAREAGRVHTIECLRAEMAVHDTALLHVIEGLHLEMVTCEDTHLHMDKALHAEVRHLQIDMTSSDV